MDEEKRGGEKPKSPSQSMRRDGKENFSTAHGKKKDSASRPKRKKATCAHPGATRQNVPAVFLKKGEGS